MKEEVISAINYVRKYKTKTDRIEIKTANVSFPKKCYDTISSFSNKSGGFIIFGLSENNNFETEGVYDVNNLQKHLADLCTDAMQSSIRQEIMSFDFENKSILSGLAVEKQKKLYPTLTGTMLFGLYLQYFYPQLFVACTSVSEKKLGDTGLDKERFIDNKRVKGSIEEMLDAALNFLRRNMKTKVIIDSYGKKTDITEYPIDALIHRDYSSYTERGYISVNMCEDRLEIINPGALYGPNKLDKIFDSTFMEVRNPTIVKILKKKHSIVENRHTDIKTIMRKIEKYNLPKPEFYEERDCFKIVFKNSIKYQEELLSGQQILLSDTQIEVLEYCNEAKSVKEIREYLNIKSRQYISSQFINSLIDFGILEYTNKNNYKTRNKKYITIKKDVTY